MRLAISIDEGVLFWFARSAINHYLRFGEKTKGYNKAVVISVGDSSARINT